MLMFIQKQLFILTCEKWYTKICFSDMRRSVDPQTADELGMFVFCPDMRFMESCPDQYGGDVDMRSSGQWGV